MRHSKGAQNRCINLSVVFTVLAKLCNTSLFEYHTPQRVLTPVGRWKMEKVFMENPVKKLAFFTIFHHLQKSSRAAKSYFSGRFEQHRWWKMATNGEHFYGESVERLVFLTMNTSPLLSPVTFLWNFSHYTRFTWCINLITKTKTKSLVVFLDV